MPVTPCALGLAGDVFHPAWEIKSNETSLRALAPCQSLGAFYSRPSSATLKFYRRLSDWMIHSHPAQWDQAAWNEVGWSFTMHSERPVALLLTSSICQSVTTKLLPGNPC